LTSPYLALPHGTEPLDHARSLARSHDGFVTSGLVTGAVRAVVQDSWRRSREKGVDPDAVLPPVELEGAELEDYRDAHPLAAVLPVIRRLLVEDAVDCDLLVAVSDEFGRLLWVEGAPGLRTRAEGMNFLAGARWSEDYAGTNAPGTALALDHGVQIFAHEHYSRIVQPWSCTAAPIHDPSTGRIVGVLDVTGGDLVATPQSMALVQAAVHAVETELRLQAITARPAGRIRRATRHATRNAVATRRLDVLGVDHGVLHLGGESRTLSQRHSEILLLLSTHPQGLTTEQLALELHADDLPLVTVRAEMSRLRGVLGDLAPTSRPYRLPQPLESDAAHLDAALRSGDVVPAVRAYRGAVLPHSDAPGVVRIRRRLHDRLRAAVLGSGDVPLLLEWGDGPGADDSEVWTTALRLLTAGSPQHALARLRLAALDEEFGIPSPR
jgi:transcriptional regulator of acetoin/glycerol metabolism